MYSDYEEVYFENANVVTRIMNEIILESLIFGFIESNKIFGYGVTLCIQNVISEFMNYEI